MKQLKNILILFSLLLAGLFYFLYNNTTQALEVVPLYPAPTNGTTEIREGGDDGDSQAKREAWFELMHSAAPGTDWKRIEYQTSMSRHINRNRLRNSANNRGDEETVANGHLTGQWNERGSINQAGSVFVTEYDPQTDEIYLISAGGSLFKGSRAGNDWVVLNDDLRFENNLLKKIQIASGERLLANIVDLPHYSDDDGQTWTPATGIDFTNSNGRSLWPVVIEQADSNKVYMLSKSSFWDDYNLYFSNDNGETYSVIAGFDDSNSQKYVMQKPHHSDEIYLIEKSNNTSIRLYKVNQEINQIELLTQNDNFGFGNVRANLASVQVDNVTRFVVYDDNNDVYQSEDFGNTWTLKGQMPTRPWSVGMYVSPSNPDFITYGEVECYVSPNGGTDWFKLNNWWDYYGDVNGSLHADMMYFNEFEMSNGESFILNSNHGGLNISYDFYDTKDNLGLANLNVSQYYDVVTDPTDPSYIYAGSQDQGFQRALSFDSEEIVSFEQVISGDYGHIVFAEGGERMWTVYPGGWVTLYNFPQFGNISASWEVNSPDETVWIPPIMPSPDPTENAVYLAGGNMEGGPGSYLIKLSYNSNLQSIDTAQIDYNFQSFSGGGTISMMRTSPLNQNHWYVSTTNGRFFYSTDGGNSWEQNIQFIPEGHYLYGSAIYPSKLDENTIYFGGSGYSNPAVYKSTDGGENFTAMNDGLPPTLVFEIAANEDESMLFAATEAGPYVYVVADEQWYDMSGIGAPNQTYWSVEYVEEFQTIRFGTYGRGIWDFQIKDEVSTSQPYLANDALNIFPNPTSDLLNIQLEKVEAETLNLTIRDIKGREIFQRSYELLAGQDFSEQLSLANLVKGNYLISLSYGNKLATKKFVVQ